KTGGTSWPYGHGCVSTTDGSDHAAPLVQARYRRGYRERKNPGQAPFSPNLPAREKPKPVQQRTTEPQGRLIMREIRGARSAPAPAGCPTGVANHRPPPPQGPFFSLAV